MWSQMCVSEAGQGRERRRHVGTGRAHRRFGRCSPFRTSGGAEGWDPASCEQMVRRKSVTKGRLAGLELAPTPERYVATRRLAATKV